MSFLGLLRRLGPRLLARSFAGLGAVILRERLWRGP
jgi:hypothetical protein